MAGQMGAECDLGRRSTAGPARGPGLCAVRQVSHGSGFCSHLHAGAEQLSGHDMVRHSPTCTSKHSFPSSPGASFTTSHASHASSATLCCTQVEWHPQGLPGKSARPALPNAAGEHVGQFGPADAAGCSIKSCSGWASLQQAVSSGGELMPAAAAPLQMTVVQGCAALC